MHNDKVVNTRVSKRLYEKIASKAKKNRVSISNLIRNLVEDTLEIHEDIHEAIDKKMRKYFTEEDKENIIAFQEVTLTKNISCDNCDKKLSVGDLGYLAIVADTHTKVVFCLSCKNAHARNPNH